MSKLIKTWAITDNLDFGPADVEYCTSVGIQLEVSHEKKQNIDYAGRTYQFAGSPRIIKLYTFDEKGESMLQLRYGSRVLLLHMMNYDSITLPYYINGEI